MVDSKDWEKWYEEMMRRFKELHKMKTQESAKAYNIVHPVFDVDECGTLGVMSIEHFTVFNKFINEGIEKELMQECINESYEGSNIK